MKWFNLAAEQGEAVAQFYLGEMYDLGHGVELDRNIATEWYRKAAEQGHVVAQYVLGMSYFRGYGVERDDEEAVRWLTEAAKQGYMQAQYQLGVMYDYGYGVEEDDETAVEWYIEATSPESVGARNHSGEFEESYKEAVRHFRQAADQGFADAQFRLGLMYDLGYGVERDVEKAVELYSLAAKQGYRMAQMYLEKYLEKLSNKVKKR